MTAGSLLRTIRLAVSQMARNERDAMDDNELVERICGVFSLVSQRLDGYGVSEPLDIESYADNIRQNIALSEPGSATERMLLDELRSLVKLCGTETG